MKLLVIILCLFSERYLIHGIAHERFRWFPQYQRTVIGFLEKYAVLNILWVRWIILLAPLLVVVALALCLLQSLFWGLLVFISHLFIFYYCIGPDNAFYPPAGELLERGENPAKPYFQNVNSQLFTPIFWYLLLGPLMLVFYRLNTQLSSNQPYSSFSEKLSAVLEWVPARLTAMSYLLAGNFQRGFGVFKNYIFSSIASNKALLGDTGLAASDDNSEGLVSLPQAESLVEQSLIIYLAGFSLFIIATWL